MSLLLRGMSRVQILILQNAVGEDELAVSTVLSFSDSERKAVMKSSVVMSIALAVSSFLLTVVLFNVLSAHSAQAQTPYGQPGLAGPLCCYDCSGHTVVNAYEGAFVLEDGLCHPFAQQPCTPDPQ